MTPGVVEVERQRLRMTGETDDETVVVRDRSVANFSSPAEGAVRNSGANKGVGVFKTQMAPDTVSAMPIKNVTDPGNLIFSRRAIHKPFRVTLQL